MRQATDPLKTQRVYLLLRDQIVSGELAAGARLPGEPTLAEALGAVLLCGGIAIWFEVSFLLAAMVLGTVVAGIVATAWLSRRLRRSEGDGPPREGG